MTERSQVGVITKLLLEWNDGSDAALAALLPLVYDELRRLAELQLRRERSGHTLQRTALVHEAFLRLVDQRQVDWRGRSQFYALAAQAMRRVLVDHARRHAAQKRGGNAIRVDLDDDHGDIELEIADGTDPRADVVAIDDALRRLEALDARQGKLVELRFFGGLNIEDTARALGVSPATVKRDWTSARAWLHRELDASRGP